MNHSDFSVGAPFWTTSGEWRCTDIGRRTVIAIRIERERDPSWYNGPTYAVAEIVFDEDDLEACFPTEAEMRAEMDG